MSPTVPAAQAPPAAGALQSGLLEPVAQYYAARLQRYGPTPLGVDWTCVPTQEMRFVQLLKLCDFGAPFSLNDLGCGYGALLGMLRRRHRGTRVDYLGIDIAPAMVGSAQKLWRRQAHASFVCAGTCPRVADYAVASGLFNVRLHLAQAAWTAFIADTLAGLRQTSRLGFAVNFLRALSAAQSGPHELYRVSPDTWARHCERELGCEVELLDAYGMREFTLLARPRR